MTTATTHQLEKNISCGIAFSPCCSDVEVNQSTVTSLLAMVTGATEPACDHTNQGHQWCWSEVKQTWKLQPEITVKLCFSACCYSLKQWRVLVLIWSFIIAKCKLLICVWPCPVTAWVGQCQCGSSLFSLDVRSRFEFLFLKISSWSCVRFGDVKIRHMDILDIFFKLQA